MATIQCQVSWDATNKKVVQTYHVVSIDEKADKFQLATTDSAPFVVKWTADLAEQMKLQKAQNTDGQDDLYQIGKVSNPVSQPHYSGTSTSLVCGTLDAKGHFVDWQSGFRFPK
jgi:hypothetical protein